MSVPNGHFSRAKTLHLAGKHEQAESIYLRLLDQNPTDSEILHLLGLLHADTNRFDTSVQLIRTAIGIDGPKPQFCRNLGVVLERCGERAAAIACFRQALAESPNDHETWVILARSLDAEERFAEAADAWLSAVKSAPYGDRRGQPCRVARANSLALAGQQALAIEEYSHVLAAHPLHLEALFHRAVAYMQENKREQAIIGFRKVLELDPGHARAANNLGILAQLGRDYEKAIDYYRIAIRSDRDYDAAIYNLGSARQEANQPQAARCVFRKLLKRNPDHASAWTNFGNAWLASNRTETAIECYRKSLSITPGEPAAEWNLGIVALLTGNFEDGWRGYERRFEVPGATPRRRFAAPVWCGEPLAGKSLLLHAEQGLGDTLQFIRYAKDLAAAGARIHVECQASLLPLLREMECVDEWHPAANTTESGAGAAGVDHLPQTDYQLPLLSAPAIAGTKIDTIPYPNGYMQAPEAARRKWEGWLGPRGRQARVGICWAGNPNHKNDRNRSVPADLLSELEGVPGIEWICLQKGSALPMGMGPRNASRELRDFADTAGLIGNLDLVISVDTAVAHLAGALGKRVWVLLPFAPDWRWMLDRVDSPWYASARLYRQAEAGQWNPVLRAVAHDLRDGRWLEWTTERGKPQRRWNYAAGGGMR